MKLRDWLKNRKSRPGETSGNRISSARESYERGLLKAPPQKKAWLVDIDGTKHYHDIDVFSDGKTSAEIRTRLHKVSGEIETKLYAYYEEADGYLVFKEFKAP